MWDWRFPKVEAGPLGLWRLGHIIFITNIIIISSVIIITIVIISISIGISIRGALLRQIRSFFEHCSKGGVGEGIKPMFKKYVANFV